ncbi:MAG: aminotransferase class IV, partial [Chitinophagales bacterium]|nr:aminotransferase class IV [Chitinophagales bacterium]
IFWIETEDDYLTSYELKKVSCVGISKKYYKSKHFLNNIKSSSALLHVMAALEAKQMGWEDLILLNEEGLVCETIHSNIFFVNEKDEVVTPPLNSGCLAGVMRAATIDILKSEGCCIEERNIHPNEIPNFKEAFSTNAGSGISQIAQIADTFFKSNLFSIKICHALNKKIDIL